MQVKPLTLSTLGLAALVTTGLLSFTTVTSYADDQAVKRDEDTPDVVLVSDDDDDDTNDPTANTANTNTANTAESDVNTNTSTNTAGNTNSNDGSGADDDSRSRLVKDWTKDGPGDTGTRDWSVNHTNDQSRHNTRR